MNCGRVDPRLAEVGVLVAHERLQRGHHERDAGLEQARHLVAERLPGARREDAGHAPAAERRADDVDLLLAERALAEEEPEEVAERLGLGVLLLPDAAVVNGRCRRQTALAAVGVRRPNLGRHTARGHPPHEPLAQPGEPGPL